MESLRKLHNSCKSDVIKFVVRPYMTVLDCGCGRGGDFWKWKATKATLYVIDPDESALVEAHKRAKEMNYKVFCLGIGDIRNIGGQFDAICYNFSLHYIMSSFTESIEAIKRTLKPGGYLFGITPDKERAHEMAPSGHFRDSLGNQFEIIDESIRVQVGGPFYSDGSRDEPLISFHDLKALGFECLVWEPMLPRKNGLISDLYSTFVFRKSIE